VNEPVLRFCVPWKLLVEEEFDENEDDGDSVALEEAFCVELSSRGEFVVTDVILTG